jgi:hypothetical protein
MVGNQVIIFQDLAAAAAAAAVGAVVMSAGFMFMGVAERHVGEDHHRGRWCGHLDFKYSLCRQHTATAQQQGLVPCMDLVMCL